MLPRFFTLPHQLSVMCWASSARVTSAVGWVALAQLARRLALIACVTISSVSSCVQRKVDGCQCRGRHTIADPTASGWGVGVVSGRSIVGRCDTTTRSHPARTRGVPFHRRAPPNAAPPLPLPPALPLSLYSFVLKKLPSPWERLVSSTPGICAASLRRYRTGAHTGPTVPVDDDARPCGCGCV